MGFMPAPWSSRSFLVHLGTCSKSLPFFRPQVAARSLWLITSRIPLTQKSSLLSWLSPIELFCRNQVPAGPLLKVTCSPSSSSFLDDLNNKPFLAQLHLSIFKIYFTYVCICVSVCVCMPVHACAYHLVKKSMMAGKNVRSPGTKVTHSYEPLCLCWESE